MKRARSPPAAARQEQQAQLAGRQLREQPANQPQPAQPPARKPALPSRGTPPTVPNAAPSAAPNANVRALAPLNRFAAQRQAQAAAAQTLRAEREAAERAAREQATRDKWAALRAAADERRAALAARTAAAEGEIRAGLEAAAERLLDDNDARVARIRADATAQCDCIEACSAAARADTAAAAAAETEHARRCEHAEEDESVFRYEAKEGSEQAALSATRLAALDVTLAERLAQLSAAELDAKEAAGNETRMKDGSCGVTREVAAIFDEMERLDKATVEARQGAIALEVDRRRLFNLHEELKGTIRVYCRVKGGSSAAEPIAAKFSFPLTGAPFGGAPPPPPPAAACGGAGRASTLSSASSASGVSSVASSASAAGTAPVPAGSLPPCRTLELVQRRENATSTGKREIQHSFSYDCVFGPQCTQGDVFAEVGPLVDCAVDGFKVCILAYGQTGSGKTHTMEGQLDSEEGRGIIPRAIQKVFDRVAALAAEGWDYTAKCTFVEVYNDVVRDLLNTDDAYHSEFTNMRGDFRDKHEIQHKEKGDTVITKVIERDVKCPADVHALLRIAVGNRSTARTNMNDRSSRSHCVFTMRLTGTNLKIGQRSVGTLCLVDLAGSERVHDSGAQGQQFKEAVAINRSLSALGDCISALGSANAHVSWRSNKLTYLLQSYLGGEGAKVLMFVMVSNREEHVCETLNSLRFAAKVNATRVGTAKKRVMQL